MIKHLVFFKVKDGIGNLDKNQILQNIKEKLDKLPDLIEEIKYYEVGINVTDSPRSWDISLISGFNNADDLTYYKDHPEHLKVVEYIKEVTTSSAVVDYDDSK